MKIAYITLAKKNSERFPNKNILLMQYTFDFMKGHKDYYVITNDHSIKDMAIKNKFCVIDEPEYYANNEAKVNEVANWIHDKIKADIYVMLPFTSPLRTHGIMKRALDIFLSLKINSMVSIYNESRETKRLSGAYWFYRKEQLKCNDLINFETLYFNSIYNFDIDTKADYEEFMRYKDEYKIDCGTLL
jgi:CMP-N-acetylneuraminic acid synthetase